MDGGGSASESSGAAQEPQWFGVAAELTAHYGGEIGYWLTTPFWLMVPAYESMRRQTARDKLTAVTIARIASADPKSSAVRDVIRQWEREASADDAPTPVTQVGISAAMAHMGFVEAMPDG